MTRAVAAASASCRCTPSGPSVAPRRPGRAWSWSVPSLSLPGLRRPAGAYEPVHFGADLDDPANTRAACCPGHHRRDHRITRDRAASSLQPRLPAASRAPRSAARATRMQSPAPPLLVLRLSVQLAQLVLGMCHDRVVYARPDCALPGTAAPCFSSVDHPSGTAGRRSVIIGPGPGAA